MNQNKIPIQITDTVRGLRQFPLSVVTLCIAQPLSASLTSCPKEGALLDMICGEPAYIFDGERGGYVCTEHGGALWEDNTREERERCYLKAIKQNPFRQKSIADLPEPARALKALEWIKDEIRGLYQFDHKQASAADFNNAWPALWQHVAATLTNQTRLSVERVLIRSDN
jgi:hypothetical protein